MLTLIRPVDLDPPNQGDPSVQDDPSGQDNQILFFIIICLYLIHGENLDKIDQAVQE